MTRSLALAAVILVQVLSGSVAAQQPAVPDTSKVGPQVGTAVPDFSGVDQAGKTHTLQSTLGPKGAMLVFFRSADW